MHTKSKIAGLLLLAALPHVLLGQPDFSRPVEAAGIRCFFDSSDEQMIYYSPGALSIARDREEQPDFNFLQTRYTGNVIYDDRNSIRFNSVIRFRVVMEQIPAEKIGAIKSILRPGKNSVQLRPLPLSDIKSNLVFTPVEKNSPASDTTTFSGGNLSAENRKGRSQKGTYWREREYSLRLEKHSSQAVRNMLEKGQTLMSLTYAFFSDGVNAPPETLLSNGEKKLLEEITETVEQKRDSVEIKRVCVRSDAFSVRLDAGKWPELMRQVDINEQVPPGYAALEVRCYDFNNRLRSGLFAKQIEIKAKGAGRGDVVSKAAFSKEDPDINVHHIKFPYAVRLDQPFYYRVTSISQEKPPERTPWIKRERWADIIDITSSATQKAEASDEY